MSECRVEVTFERGVTSFAPGAELAGTVRLSGTEPFGRSELSVLFYTDGKGNTDLGVVHHERLSNDETTHELEKSFRVRLPLLPLSYSGTLLSIFWVARVRIFGALGQDQIEDTRFVVGAGR